MNSRALSFSTKIFWSVAFLFMAFTLCFVAFQYRREKLYKVELLNLKLDNFNNMMAQHLDNMSNADDYLKENGSKDLRCTIILPNGKVIYDNMVSDLNSISNHSNRKEVVGALQNGKAYDIKILSASLGKPFFFYATYFPQKGYIIRSGLPYNLSLINMLASDKTYIWFAFALILILILVYYTYIRKLGQTIESLKVFSQKAEERKEINFNNFLFPNNDLGDISKHIINLYAQLLNSEDDKTRLKRQLTQNIAHELKTPVSSIQGFLETIISDKTIDENTKTEFIQRCYSQSIRLSNLLRDMSLLTRMDESFSNWALEKIDINKVIEDIIKDTSLELKEKSMKVFNLTESNLYIKGDYNLLYSIFRNLMDNSIAYAGVGSIVTIKLLEKNKECLKFSFADNGDGVSQEHIKHLFERFYRVDKGRSRRLGGTGLGLAIVKNAVLIHGGTISACLDETGGLKYIFTLRF